MPVVQNKQDCPKDSGHWELFKDAIASQSEALQVTEVVLTVEAVTTPQLPSAETAKTNLETLTVAQLRKLAEEFNINWRTGGDYGKAMRKAQLLAALT